MNIDIVLFAGRIVLVALLYIFLFAVMKTGGGTCARTAPRLGYLDDRCGQGPRASVAST